MIKIFSHSAIGVLFAALAFLFFTNTTVAQNATEVDPDHYKVEFENDYVRIVRISYGPKEKSVMHDHMAHVAVFLTDGKVTFTYPDGKTEEMTAKTGVTRWSPAITHLPENSLDKPFELILVEIKNVEEEE